MREIKLTQGQVALVDDCDCGHLMQWKWYADWQYNCFRAKRTSKVDGKRKTILMHTSVAKRMGIDTTQIDHRDRNPLNNQRSNLRVATHSQNGHNRGTQKNSKTGVKGVSFNKEKGKYRAQITVEGRYYFLGYFDTIPKAEAIVIAKREELVIEFAHH